MAKKRLVRENVNFHTALFEAFKSWLRSTLYKARIDLCFDESDGFDVAIFTGTWKRALGPFLLHRQYLNEVSMVVDCPAYGPWRLMIALTTEAWGGFDEACGK